MNSFLQKIFVALFVCTLLFSTIVAQGGKDKATTTKTQATEVVESVKENSTELNIYSSRHYDVDKEVYKAFEAKTGITVNVVEGKGGELMERIVREKNAAKADIFLTVGAETIYPLTDKGLFENFSSKFIESKVSPMYRGAGWTGVMSRARVIAYSKDRVDPKAITSYADLTKPEWKGKILVRSSSSSYNLALLSSFVLLEGQDAAESWAQAVVKNMARTPKGNDRDQAKAIVAGEGDLAIMNSYYYVRMANSSDPAERDVVKKVALIFPKETHVNLSYGGILAGAKNKANAVKFLEFLLSEEIQVLYAQKNGEFPLNKDVGLPKIQASWGAFTPQNIDYSQLGSAKDTATIIFDKVGWK